MFGKNKTTGDYLVFLLGNELQKLFSIHLLSNGCFESGELDTRDDTE